MVEDLPVPEGVEVDPILSTARVSHPTGYYKGDNIPVLNLLRHSQKSLLDVGRVLSRGLQERNGQLVREFLQFDQRES